MPWSTRADRVGFTGLGLSARDTIADVAFAALGHGHCGGITWSRWRRPPDAGLAVAPARVAGAADVG